MGGKETKRGRKKRRRAKETKTRRVGGKEKRRLRVLGKK